MGIVLGFFFNWLFQDLPENLNWRVMLLCGIFLPTLLIVLTLTFMPRITTVVDHERQGRGGQGCLEEDTPQARTLMQS